MEIHVKVSLFFRFSIKTVIKYTCFTHIVASKFKHCDWWRHTLRHAKNIKYQLYSIPGLLHSNLAPKI